MLKIKIGVFDSGIGGVTVLNECIRLNPNYEYLYYSDSLHNPYGDKNKDEVISYCEVIVKYFIKKGCKIIIIACNTASAISVKYLRDKYRNIYFIAIEPAIKLAYNNSCDGTLILATKGTIDSDKFKVLYDKYHHDNFYLYSCVGLANLIEDGDRDKIYNYIKDNLAIYDGKVSNIVLGCTHYPLIKDIISMVIHDVTFYDGGIGVAKHLDNYLKNNNYSGDEKIIIFKDSTGDVEKENRFYELLGSDNY